MSATMTPTISRLLCIITYVLILRCASARHIHRRPAHQHQHSKRATPVVLPDAVSPVMENIPASITAGNDAIEDIEGIQEGLTNLPGDLLSFIQAVEARLGEVEGMLSSLMATSASTLTVPSSPTRMPPAPFLTSTATANITATSTIIASAEPVFFTTSSPSPSTTSNLPGVVPVVPYPTSFRTSRITSTRVKTVTLQQPQATRMAWPPFNGTAPRGNYTVTYTATGALTPIPIRTFTVVPAPDSGAPLNSTSSSSTSI